MKKSHIALLLGAAIVFVWSGIHPHDRLTWWLEVFPAIIGLIILAATYRRFQFTTLVYTLIAIHICILCVGGHWTYAREPVFNWQGSFSLEPQSLRPAWPFRAGIRAGVDRARDVHSAEHSQSQTLDAVPHHLDLSRDQCDV